MNIDEGLLERFERGLDPQNLKGSEIPATLVGYGEISSIFQIGDDDAVVYKRMPLFTDRSSAKLYEDQYHEYCAFLEESGLTLPESSTHIIEVPDRPISLYIAQRKFPGQSIASNLMHELNQEDIAVMMEKIVREIAKVWAFNRSRGPSLELAIDGQISNWVYLPDVEGPCLYYIDTSTPLYRKEGQEQLNAELLLQAVPVFLRWIVRLMFLKDILNRYYEPRQVYTDLAANLFKEQRPDLIPMAIDNINRNLPAEFPALTDRDVEKYYKEDKFIWSFLLAARRFECRLTTQVLRKRYEFILPGKIKR